VSKEIIAGESLENESQFNCFGTILRNDNRLVIELEAE
jgi:hypothetical protein